MADDDEVALAVEGPARERNRSIISSMPPHHAATNRRSRSSRCGRSSSASGAAYQETGPDDLTQINGNREQLEGEIQARYEHAKDQVKKDVDTWVNNLP